MMSDVGLTHGRDIPDKREPHHKGTDMSHRHCVHARSVAMYTSPAAALLLFMSSSSCTVVSLLYLRSPSARAHPSMYVARNVTIAVFHHGTIAVSHHGVVACVARPCMSSALPLCAVRRLCVHSHAGRQPWSRRCNAVQEPAACLLGQKPPVCRTDSAYP